MKLADITKEELKEHIPLGHLSYSSIKQYLEDQQTFRDWYVLNLWDDIETGVAYVVGEAVHKWIEIYWSMIKNGETITPATKDIVIQDAIKFAEAKVADAEKNEKMVWGKNWTMADIVEAVNTVLTEYMAKPPVMDPLYIEYSDVFTFSDLEGVEMPFPIKVKIDWIGRDKNGDLIIVDHKTVKVGTQIQQDEPCPPWFHLQAAIYYLGCIRATGEAPKRIEFHQIPKGVPNPASGLYQADLRRMCEESGLGWEKYEKNGDLVDKLIKNNVLKAPEYITPYVIDYTQDTSSIQAFIEIYKAVVMDIYIKAKYELPFLPNPFKQFGGDKVYAKYLADTI